jgi:DNA-binding transcriptional LysR family regulator
MDRLDAMRVLVAVVDSGSLSAASRKLNSPLPSVSRKVAELEHQLGARLLIRTSRNIQLTDAGRDYVEAVRQIIAQISDAELRASGEYETPRGELRLTVTNAFGHSIALPLAYQFLAEHPEITLNVLSTNRNVDLTEERVDVGIRIGQLSDSSLIAVKVGAIRSVTCASPDYFERKGRPQSPADLAGHDGVQFGTVNWSYAGVEPTVDPSIRVHASDVSAACAATVQGLGISRLPNFMITEELRAGQLIEVLGDYGPEPYPVHIIYVKQGLLPLKVRAFIDWMTPRLRERLKGCAER